MNEMTLSPKAVNMLRVSMAECEKAIGTEYADVYTAKHIATLETILELAEDSKVEQVIISTESEPVNLDEDVEEVAEEVVEEPATATKADTLHAQVIQMRNDGKKVKEIAEALNIGVSTVYWHLKFERDMRAK